MHLQELPEREEWWYMAMPPSSLMDFYSFCLANKVVGNGDEATIFECLIHGPTLLFH
jgi:allophanate hydrolase subunit 2